MKKILIAGGTGFLGKALIRHLINCGYTVNVLTRRSSNISTENIQYFLWDIEKSYIDEKAFEGVTKIIELTLAKNVGLIKEKSKSLKAEPRQ